MKIHIQKLVQLVFVALATCALPSAVRAASHTWSGAVNGLFSNAGNWSSGGVPTLAETNSLTFPDGVARTVITNDIGALKVSAFGFSGGNYVIRGASTFSIQPNLINFLCSAGSNTIESALSFAAIGSFSIGTSRTLVLAGALSGTDGLVKNGAGDLYLRGTASNPLSGDMQINFGDVHFQKSGGASPYNGNTILLGTTNVSDLTHLFTYADNQIPDGAAIEFLPSGSLRLNDHSDTVGSVTMTGGIIDTGAGKLTINGDLALTPRFVGLDILNQPVFESPTLWGTIEFGGASRSISVSTNTCKIEAAIVDAGAVTALNKTGPGTLELRGNNTFPGQFNALEGTAFAYNFDALGTTAGSTVVSNGATLIIPDGVTFSEPLVLSGSGQNGGGALRLNGGGNTTCNGLITVSNLARVFVPAGQQLQFSSVVSGPGGIAKTGLGDFTLAGGSANTFSGASLVAQGKLTLNKNDHVRALASVTVTNGAELVLDSHEQIDNAAIVSVCSGGLFTMANHDESVGGLNVGGGVVVDSGTATLTLLGNYFAGAPYSTNSAPYDTILRGKLSLGGATRVFDADGYGIVLDCNISDGAGVGGLQLGPADGFNAPYSTLVRSNSFSGPVFVAGVCTISNDFAFGAPSGGVFDLGPFYSGIRLAAPAVSVTGETLTITNFLELTGLGANAWNGPIAISKPSGLSTFAVPGAVLTMGGSISGPGGLYAQGSGLLRLMQSNSYAGPTIIAGDSSSGYGTVALRHPQSLGSAAQGTQVDEGTTLRLELPNGAVVAGEPLSYHFTGSTANTNNWLRVDGAVSNTWNGPVTLDIPVQVDVPESNAVFTINNDIGGASGLEKRGPGKLILAGTGTNSFLGETVVSGGILRLQKPNGVQATADLTVNPLGRLEWGGSEQIADAAALSLVGYAFSGVTNAFLANHSETVTHLSVQHSVLDAGAGTFTLFGDVDVSNPTLFDSHSSIFGTVRLGPGPHLIFKGNTNNFVGAGALSVWGSIHETGGSAGLTIADGLVWLRGSNSFTGPIVVDDAMLNIRHPYALGDTAQGTLLTNYGLLDLALPSGSVMPPEPLVMAAPAPGDPDLNALTMIGEYTNTWTGPITLQGSNQFVISLGSELTVTGPVAGPGPLLANGQLILAGSLSNSFGDLFVEGGPVRLAKPAGTPAFTGNLTLKSSGSPGTPTAVILEAPGQILPQTTVTVGPDGTNARFDLNGHAATIARLLGAGEVQTGPGTLIISNSTAQYSGFLGAIQGTGGGVNLIHRGLGTQRATFALDGSLLLQSGTMYCDGGYLGALDLSAGAVMDMYSLEAHFGSLSGAGKIITSGGVIHVGASHQSTTFAGVIEGFSSTNLIKVGTGALTLTGVNTDTGKTVVRNGVLLVNGALAGPVAVESIGAPYSATLGGTGQVQNVTVSGLTSRLAPGATTNTPSYGRLRVNNLTLGTDGSYQCEIGGTNAGVNLDQIDATGTVTLSGGFANFTASGLGVVSNRYAVVKSVAPVSGTFLDDPEGDYLYPAAGRVMQITYLTAGGQEVTLIEQVGAPPSNSVLSNIVRQTNGNITITGTGTIGAIYDVLANTNVATTNWINIGTILGAWDGSLTFTDTNAPSFPQRYYRLFKP